MYNKKVTTDLQNFYFTLEPYDNLCIKFSSIFMKSKNIFLKIRSIYLMRLIVIFSGNKFVVLKQTIYISIV